MASGDEPRVDTTTHYNEGMSVRTWLVGMAMQGLLANQASESTINGLICDAFTYADAVLAELEKQP